MVDGRTSDSEYKIFIIDHQQIHVYSIISELKCFYERMPSIPILKRKLQIFSFICLTMFHKFLCLSKWSCIVSVYYILYFFKKRLTFDTFVYYFVILYSYTHLTNLSTPFPTTPQVKYLEIGGYFTHLCQWSANDLHVT